jgi:hypothetical protein
MSILPLADADETHVSTIKAAIFGHACPRANILDAPFASRAPR